MTDFITNQADAWAHLQKYLRKDREGTDGPVIALGVQLSVVRIVSGKGRYWRIFLKTSPHKYFIPDSYTVFASGRIIDPEKNSVLQWEV
jgi:hypothetical protein